MEGTGRPTRALVVVDVQNDFCEGGSLAVTGGARVAAAITAHLAAHGPDYAAVVATRDWHLPPPDDNGGHFALTGEPNWTTTWPVHCVQGTTGAEYHPDLHLPEDTSHVVKGEGVPAYSGFEGRMDTLGPDIGASLADLLHRRRIEAIDVVGLATDHCVRATALDGRKEGLDVRVITDLAAGVDPGRTEAVLAELREAGVEVVAAP